MKNFKMILMAVFALLVTVGCSGNNENKGGTNTNENITAREILDAIQEKMAEAYGITVDENVLAGYHIMDLNSQEETQFFFLAEHFNLEDIKEGYVLEPMMSMVRSELVIVVEANTPEAAANVAASMAEIRSSQEATWSTYLPDQYEFVRNNKIITHGNFVLYVTSEHVDAIVEAFEAQVR